MVGCYERECGAGDSGAGHRSSDDGARLGPLEDCRCWREHGACSRRGWTGGVGYGKEYVAESLLEVLPRSFGGHVLIARAAVARDVIPDELRRRGAQVDVVEAYRTVVPESSLEKIAAAFAGEAPEAATFTSSSTVTNFFQLLREAGCERPDGMPAVSIGPITSRTLREHGWEPAAEADPHDVAGLVAATVRVLGD